MKKILWLLTITLLGSTPALAETRYVTDIFEITMRSGKSTQNEILRMLPSGSALEVLEVDSASGYTRVKTKDGKEGWVISRYLMDIPSARHRLSRAETRLANLEQELDNTRQQLAQVSEEKQQLDKERNRLVTQNKKLAGQLDEITRVSSNAIQLSTENQTLRKRLAETDREIQFLQQENVVLRDRSNRDWFVIGALVVVASMIFGIILTRIRWRKQSSWNDI